MDTDILIVGGGLSGLALADKLHRAGRDVLLVEARPRFGGRILGASTEKGTYDLGPAWYWPGQPRMAALAERLGLETFEQHSAGELTYEDERGVVHRGQGYASMQGSLRLVGGMQAMIEGLAGGLPRARLRSGVAVTEVIQDGASIMARLADGREITARDVVFAAPPRVLAETIRFTPRLPAEVVEALSAVPTWMAGQAKAVAVYDTPFWRADGLSGDAMSRFGPMVEIHDASPASAAEGALFGFIGVPTRARQDKAAIEAAVRAQLVQMFGPAASEPKALFLQDWAFELFTARASDHDMPNSHPRYGTPAALAGLWDGHLHFAGTEFAPEFGGYLEGALEAADRVAARLAAQHAEEEMAGT